MIKSPIQNKFSSWANVISIYYDMYNSLHANILKLMFLTKTSIILKNFYDICGCKFTNRLKDSQPENSQKFEDKPD